MQLERCCLNFLQLCMMVVHTVQWFCADAGAALVPADPAWGASCDGDDPGESGHDHLRGNGLRKDDASAAVPLRSRIHTVSRLMLSMPLAQVTSMFWKIITLFQNCIVAVLASCFLKYYTWFYCIGYVNFCFLIVPDRRIDVASCSFDLNEYRLVHFTIPLKRLRSA